MEPNILLVGKNLDSLDVLKEELIKFDRKIVLATSAETITAQLSQEKIDFVVLGAGLPEDTITAMSQLIADKNPDLPVHVMKKSPGMNPTHMIGYTNEKAIMWKLLAARTAHQ